MPEVVALTSQVQALRQRLIGWRFFFFRFSTHRRHEASFKGNTMTTKLDRVLYTAHAIDVTRTLK